MGFPFRSRVEHDPAGSVAVVQMKDIDDANLLHAEEVVRVDIEGVKDHHLIKAGDLLFRSRGRTNSVALVGADIGLAILSAPMLLIRPTKVRPDYLLWYINLPATQELLGAKAEGTSVRMISKAALEELELPLPTQHKQALIAELATLAADEQQLMERIAHERKRLVDGSMLRFAKDAR